MKKGFLLLGIGLWTIVAVAIISAAILIANGRAEYMLISKVETLLESEEIYLGNIERIKVNCSSQNIIIRKTNGNNIKVSQYGDPDTKKDGLFLVSTTNDSVHIYIDYDKKFRFNFFSNIINNERLIIEIPETYYGNLDSTASSGSIKIEDEFKLMDVRINCSSGNIKINNNIASDTINLKTSSGSIKFNGAVTAKNVSVKASSGNIYSNMSITSDESIELNTTSGSINTKSDITTKDLYAHSSAGGIRMSYVYAESYNIKCTSGSINVESISGGGSAYTSSGNIRLALNNPKGDLDFNSTSGSIKISLEPSLQFTLTARTKSGGIRTNFNTDKNERGNYATANIGDNPTVNITATTSSGGIRVES